LFDPTGHFIAGDPDALGAHLAGAHLRQTPVQAVVKPGTALDKPMGRLQDDAGGARKFQLPGDRDGREALGRTALIMQKDQQPAGTGRINRREFQPELGRRTVRQKADRRPLRKSGHRQTRQSPP
jgi:hypothetical protein